MSRYSLALRTELPPAGARFSPAWPATCHSPGDFYFRPTLKIPAILPTANDYLF
jgi:hypothetical protein